LFSTSRS